MDYPEFMGQSADELFPHCPVPGREPERAKDYHTRIRDGVFEICRTVEAHHHIGESNDGYRGASSYTSEVDIWDRYGAVVDGIIVFDQDRLDAYHEWYAPVKRSYDLCARAKARGYNAFKIYNGSGWTARKGFHGHVIFDECPSLWDTSYDEEYFFSTLDDMELWLDHPEEWVKARTLQKQITSVHDILSLASSPARVNVMKQLEAYRDHEIRATDGKWLTVRYQMTDDQERIKQIYMSPIDSDEVIAPIHERGDTHPTWDSVDEELQAYYLEHTSEDDQHIWVGKPMTRGV